MHQRSATGWLQAADQPRRGARDGPDQSFQTRKSCGGDGRYSRTSRGGRQSRVDESQNSSEETVVGRRNKRVPKFITTAERRIKELDTERAKECTLLAEAQEHLERSAEEQSRCPAVMHGVFPDTGAQVTSPQQIFIGEGVAKGQVGSHRGTACSASGQEAGDCEAGDATVEILMVESRWCPGMCPTT